MSGSDILLRSEGTQEHRKKIAANEAWNAGKAWWDMMTGFQRASMMAFTPFVRMAGIEIAKEAESQIATRLPQPAGVQIVQVGEERLNVGTVTVPGETTRIRRRVISQPVEQQVTLRDEKVIVERRSGVNTNPTPNVLTETVIEMSDSRQVPRVWKSLHVAEEVVLRKQVTERVEHVRETVRRDVVDVEHDANSIVVPNARIESRREPMTPAPDAEAVRRVQAQEVETARRAQAQVLEAEASRRAQASNDKRAQEESLDKKPGQDTLPQPGVKKN